MNKVLSIIIPAYNEKETIVKVLEKVEKLSIAKEIIVVNDGSTDGTDKILNEYCNKLKKVKLINLERNSGKGIAIREGIKHATGDYIVIQDADVEYDPLDLVNMYDYALKNNADVVYGNRFAQKRFYQGMDLRNFLGNNFVLPFISSILYIQIIPDEATCYKMFRTEILKNANLKCKRFEFCPEITAKVRKRGYRIHFIPISYNPRKKTAGKKLNVYKDGFEAIKTLIKYRFTE